MVDGIGQPIANGLRDVDTEHIAEVFQDPVRCVFHRRSGVRSPLVNRVPHVVKALLHRLCSVLPRTRDTRRDTDNRLNHIEERANHALCKVEEAHEDGVEDVTDADPDLRQGPESGTNRSDDEDHRSEGDDRSDSGRNSSASPDGEGSSHSKDHGLRHRARDSDVIEEANDRSNDAGDEPEPCAESLRALTDGSEHALEFFGLEHVGEGGEDLLGHRKERVADLDCDHAEGRAELVGLELRRAHHGVDVVREGLRRLPDGLFLIADHVEGVEERHDRRATTLAEGVRDQLTLLDRVEASVIHLRFEQFERANQTLRTPHHVGEHACVEANGSERLFSRADRRGHRDDGGLELRRSVHGGNALVCHRCHRCAQALHRNAECLGD